MGLFYSAPQSQLQVISSRRKMTPLEIKFFFRKQDLLSKYKVFVSIILQKKIWSGYTLYGFYSILKNDVKIVVSKSRLICH